MGGGREEEGGERFNSMSSEGTHCSDRLLLFTISLLLFTTSQTTSSKATI